MKGYESYFHGCQHPSYPNQYISYGSHKEKLRQFYNRRRKLNKILRATNGILTANAFSQLIGGETVPSSALSSSSYFRHDDGQEGDVAYVDKDDAILRLSVMERKEFGAMLEEQVSNSAIYYASTLLPGAAGLLDNDDDDAAAAMVALLDAIALAITNVIPFRQLLIRYDAFCRTFDGMPLNEWHLKQSVLDVDHPVHGMFVLEGVDDLEKRIVIGLQKQELLQDSSKYTEEDGVLVEKEDGIMTGEGGGAMEKKTSAEDFTAQVQCFVYLLEKTDDSLNKAVAGHLVFKDRLLAVGMRIRQYMSFGFQSRGLTEELTSISMRGRHFKREMKIICKWRATKDFGHFSVQEDQRGTFRQNLKDVKPENVFPLFLNLVSCFLFMMNNYIIEPSSAYYAEALGSSDALSGMMIGMAPWFALVSSIAYSYWTNFNYKHPILFAGVLQFVGNLMYANAYGYKSVELCLIGRAITGLGAPRIINRRYVADATPFSLRTAASAAFAMATALGAALGPGMAILLDRMDEFEFHLPLLKEQYFNGMTGPGYFMALSWFIYTLCILFFFGEPTRSGLEELRKREEASDSRKESLLDEVELAAMSDDKSDGNFRRKSSLDDVMDREDSLSMDDADDDDLNCDASLQLSQISNSSKQDKGYSYSYCSCIKHMTKPVIICMSLIFMKRIALESIVGSTSIITKNRYGWNIENVGTLHLVNGIIVIPVSIFSGYLSTLHEDRYMSVWFLAITLVGMAFLFDPTDLLNHEDAETFNEGAPFAVGPHRYITGSLIAFSGIEACESYVASLMSKVVPSALAQGTFNSGLLATLVGTGGRATGDLFITLMGLMSIRNLLNLLIIPGAALVASSIAMILWNYEILAV